jgi:D-3-phosphoglycerate dehydrogenase
VMAALPHCRLVVRWGVGYDQIPVQDATELGVAVANAPAYGTQDVAEHAIALLLSATRHVAWFHRAIAEGEYPDSTRRSIHRMTGRTLGIIGVGRIGTAVARRGLGLGLRVLGFDAYRPGEELRALGVEPVGLDRLLEESDYVSLHVPLNHETRGLMSADLIGRLRTDAILVNTSRGRVVDEEALIDALRARRIAAAALDVFEREPLPVDSPLRTLDNVVLTPHAAGFSIEAWGDLRTDMCNTASEWIRDGWSQRVVNPEVRPKLRARLPS